MPSRSHVSVGAGIVNIRPNIIRRKTTQSEVVIEEANKGSKEVCLKTGESEDQKQILETMQSGNQMWTLTSDQAQSERCCKEVEKLESKEASNLSLVVDKENKETLYRGILESGKSMRGGAFGEMRRIEKELVLSKLVARALTDKGGELVNNIWNVSGADVRINRCQGEEQTV